MAIRIRVYPQPGSIGARRNRVIKRQQQLVRAQQRLEFARQQQLLRQQQAFMQYGGYAQPSFGSSLLGSIGSFFGFGTPQVVAPYGAYAGAAYCAPYQSNVVSQFSPYGTSYVSSRNAYSAYGYGC